MSYNGLQVQEVDRINKIILHLKNKKIYNSSNNLRSIWGDVSTRTSPLNLLLCVVFLLYYNNCNNIVSQNLSDAFGPFAVIILLLTHISLFS